MAIGVIRGPTGGTRLLHGALVLSCVACATTSTPIEPSTMLPRESLTAQGEQHFRRVLIVVLENENGPRALKVRYLRRLAKEGRYFSHFRALFHPSYPNYLAMITGRAIRTRGDAQVNFPWPTIGDRLSQASRSWRNYAEGYPGHSGRCYLRPTRWLSRYVRRHTPFLSSQRIQRQGCKSVVNAEEIWVDLRNGALPDYMFYTPNLDDDGHDSNVYQAAQWLERFLNRLRSDPAYPPGTLVIVTFDESAGHGPHDPNYVYTVFLGDMVVPGTDEREQNHYNVLRTIEENFDVPPLATADSAARPIDGWWRRSPRH